MTRELDLSPINGYSLQALYPSSAAVSNHSQLQKEKTKKKTPLYIHPYLLPLTTKKGTTGEMKREAKKNRVRKTKRGVS